MNYSGKYKRGIKQWSTHLEVHHMMRTVSVALRRRPDLFCRDTDPGSSTKEEKGGDMVEKMNRLYSHITKVFTLHSLLYKQKVLWRSLIPMVVGYGNGLT